MSVDFVTAVTQEDYAREIALISIGGDDPTTTAELTAVLDTTGPLRSATISAAGSGYAVDDVLTVSSGGGDATFTVTSVDTGGEVLTIVQTDPGTGNADGTAEATSVAPAGGTLCTLDTIADLPVASVTVDTAGAGYNYRAIAVITDPDTGDTTCELTIVLTAGAVTSVTVDSGGGYLTGGPPTLVVEKAPPLWGAGYGIALDVYEATQRDARLKSIIEDAQKTIVLVPEEVAKLQALYDSL